MQIFVIVSTKVKHFSKACGLYFSNLILILPIWICAVIDMKQGSRNSPAPQIASHAGESSSYDPGSLAYRTRLRIEDSHNY